MAYVRRNQRAFPATVRATAVYAVYLAALHQRRIGILCQWRRVHRLPFRWYEGHGHNAHQRRQRYDRRPRARQSGTGIAHQENLHVG